MATNSVTTSKNGYTLILTAQENSTDTALNTSQVTVTLSLKSNSTYFQLYVCSGSINVGGVSRAVYDQYYSFPSLSSTITLATWTGSVAHKDDGTGSVVFTGNLSCANGTYGAGTGSVSLTLPLSTIPRGSKINSVASFSLENGFSVNGTKYAGSFYDVLTLKYGSTTVKTVNGYVSGTSVTFSDSELLAIYRLLGTAKSAAFTVTLSTYTSSAKTTLVGSDSTGVTVTAAGNVRLRLGGAWRQGRLFRNVGGVWKPVLIYCKNAGNWRRGK